MSDPVVPPAALARQATLRRLRDLVRRGPGAPGGPSQRGEGDEAFISIDDELARLVYDSAADPTAGAGLRSGPPAVRRLTFEASRRVLEVEVTPSIPRRLLVHAAPRGRLVLELASGDGEPVRLLDDSGTFLLPAVAPGPIRLRCAEPDGAVSAVATSWIVI